MASVFESLSQIAYSKGISEKDIANIIKEMLLAAYRREYGTDINAVTKVSDDYSDIKIFSKKKIVERVGDSLLEISLKEAMKIDKESKVGESILLRVDLDKMGRNAINEARKVVFFKIKEINQNRLHEYFWAKKGLVISGKVQREKSGNYYLDLGSAEGILLRSDRLKTSEYEIGQQLRVLVKDLLVYRHELQIYLSRVHPLFVKRLFELEIPEIEEGKIKIEAIERDAGYKTKIAVSSKEMDPVGTCIGMKGSRISVILKELEGEQIDVIKYSSDIQEYIRNNFPRISIEKIIFQEDEEEKQILIIVNKRDLALIIGQKGRNIRLASRLIGTRLTVKSVEEASSILLESNYKQVVEKFFSNDQYIGEHSIDELEDLQPETIKKLKSYGLNILEKIVQMSKEDLLNLPNLTNEEVDQIISLIQSNVVLVEEDTESDSRENSDQDDQMEPDTESQDPENYEYYCPECDNVIQYGDQVCNSCGVEIVFE